MRVIISNEEAMDWLVVAQRHAHLNSGCTKVRVGSVVVKDNHIVALGANRAMPNLCKGERGCLRIEKYGSNSRLYRGPSDCRAIHSEIDAIAKSTQSLHGASIFVTRYPCEACARAIVAADIATVYYGREQVISVETYEIFKYGGVEVIQVQGHKEDDVVE